MKVEIATCSTFSKFYFFMVALSIEKLGLEAAQPFFDKRNSDQPLLLNLHGVKNWM